MINTSECEECVYGNVLEESKALVKIYCSQKDKIYYFGQCIPCDNKRKQKINKDATEPT